jgi:DNA-binding transcriptional LysR family regulator
MEALSANLADLFVFVNVVELKSFSEAARVSGSTKSTVSKQVRRLEQTLGAKLLNRTTRTLALTEVGHLAYQHGLRIVEEAAALRTSVEGMQATPRGHLRVTTSVAFGNLHLSHLVARFLALYPDISVTLTLSDRYVDLVEDGYDIAIRLTSKPVESFVARRLAAIDYVVAATPGYLAGHAPIVTPADLAAHNCMLNGSALHKAWRFERDGALSEVAVAGRFAVNSSESLRGALLAGLGIALLPGFAIADDLRSGALQPVLTQYRAHGSFGDSIHAVFSPSKYVAPKMRVFVDFLVVSFQDGASWHTLRGPLLAV